MGGGVLLATVMVPNLGIRTFAYPHLLAPLCSSLPHASSRYFFLFLLFSLDWMKRVLLRRPRHLGARPAGRRAAKGAGEGKVPATLTLHHPDAQHTPSTSQEWPSGRLRQDRLWVQAGPPAPQGPVRRSPRGSVCHAPPAPRAPPTPSREQRAGARGPGAPGRSAPTPRQREVCSQSVGIRRHPNSTRDPTGSAPETLTHPRARSIHAPGARLPGDPAGSVPEASRAQTCCGLPGVWIFLFSVSFLKRDLLTPCASDQGPGSA